MAKSDSKKGLSCSGMLGAFVFVVVIGFILYRFVLTSPKTGSSTPPSGIASSTSAQVQTTQATQIEEAGSVYTEDAQFSRRNYAGVYLCEATGYVVNDSGRDLVQVTITVGFYNEAGQRVSTSGDVKYGLKNGDKWFFTVSETGSDITSAKIQEIEFI